MCGAAKKKKKKKALKTPNKKTLPGDFHGGPVVKNLPSSAGNWGSIPGWRTKIPYSPGQHKQIFKKIKTLPRTILWLLPVWLGSMA